MQRPEVTRSTSPSCSPLEPRTTLPPSIANALRGRVSRLGGRLNGASWSLSPSSRIAWPRRCWTQCCPAGRRQRGSGAPAVARSRSATGSLPARARAECDPVERPDSRAAAAPRRDSRRPAWQPTPTRPTSSTTPRPQARGRRRRATRSSAARRAAALESNREAYSHYRRASNFVDRLSLPEQAAVLEELATAAYKVGRLEDAFPAIDRAIAGYRTLGDEAGVGRCTRVLSRFHWYAGDGDGRADERRSRRSRSSSRTASRASSPVRTAVLSQLAMLARRRGLRLEWGERALELAIRARRREHARARADQHRQREAPARSTSRRATLLEAPRDRGRCRRPVRGDAGARQPRPTPCMLLGAAERRAPVCGGTRSPTPRSTRCTPLASYVATMIAWLRLRAGEWDEAERIARGEIEQEQHRAPAARQDRARPSWQFVEGIPDAGERLGDLAEQAERANELQRLAPVLELGGRVGADDAARRCRTSGSMQADRADRAARRSYAGWGAIARRLRGPRSRGSTSQLDPPPSASARRDAAARLARRGRRVRRRGLDLRSSADALAARRRGGAGRGDRDLPAGSGLTR